MKLAFASLVLRLPSVVPEQLDYAWSSANYDNYVDTPASAWGVGLGGEFGLFAGPSGALDISVAADVRRRFYDTEFPMEFWSVGVPLDIGYRFDTASMGASGPIAFWFGGALGPRFTYLAAPSWPDLLAIAWGLDTSIGLTIGTGKVRANVGLRMGFDWPGGDTYGQAALTDSYVNWSFTSGGVVAAGQVGVEFH